MSKDKLKKFATSVGSGIESILVATHNSPLRTRMYEIEEEIEKLQEEYAELEEKLMTK